MLVGAYNHNQEDAEDTIDVLQMIQHEDYNRFGAGIPNDIGLVELAWPADLANPHIGLAVLPRRGEDFAGTPHCWIAGWGRLGGCYTTETSSQDKMARFCSALICMTVGNQPLHMFLSNY